MKKLVCLVLVLVLACVSVSALAAGSKSTESMSSGTAAGTVVGIGNDGATEAQKKLAEEELAKIAAAATPFDYFSDSVKAEIEALLPGVDTSALQLNELLPFSISGYDVLNGVLTINCVFPTQYQVGQKVVVLIGIQENGAVVWHSLAGTVQANGSINVTLPADILLAVGNGTAIIAVLND